MTANPSADSAAVTHAIPRNTPILFEVAWEVCSQIGGIYTVLRSKAPTMTRRWGDGYCLIGPYREASARVELEPQPAPEPIKTVMDELAAAGIRTHFGRWLITGRPQALLIDLYSVFSRLAEVKYLLWKDDGISAPAGDHEFDEIVAFGHSVAEFLVAVQRHRKHGPAAAHFHEWQGAAAIPMLARRERPVATVFTTHATLVGRNLSAANAELYEHMAHIDGGAVAHQHGFGHRHAVECAAARTCDVFTTVSGITALEAKTFLGREPDVLVPNGLNVERFAAPHEFQVLHRSNKEMIHEFVMGHFFPSYTFDLDRALYVFTAGRYEYRNKGLDVFIEALHELNQRMRAENSPVTVVAFIVTRAPYKGPNVETLNRQAMLNELRETCESIKHDMGRRLLHTVANGRLPTLSELLDEYAAVRLKRMMYAWRSGPQPTIVTHDLYDDAHDPILVHLRSRNLINLPEDRVKIVFHPEFMSATSPLLGMEYDQFIRGCHVGVFPSYYEPWGYTPLECVVSGMPAITSDLAGFGDYVMQNFPQHDSEGMYVAQRRQAPFHRAVDQIAGWLHALTQMSRRERIALRNRVESHAEHFDWKNLGRHYAEAHQMALRRRFGRGNPIPFDPELEYTGSSAPRPPEPTPPQPAKRRRGGTRKQRPN